MLPVEVEYAQIIRFVQIVRHGDEMVRVTLFCQPKRNLEGNKFFDPLRGCYELAASIAACLSIKQANATTCRPAKVVSYRS